ncbi:MAG: hypothetical protein ACO3EY_07315 [Candidatus Nanopelagicales bacterium]|jgi:hypothetical protein
MKNFKQLREQAVPVPGGAGPNVASGGPGGIAGLPPDFPPVGGKVLRRKKVEPHSRFGGKAVFKVSSDAFNKAKLGKRKFEHYTSYVGHNDVANEIREYAMQNKDEPIIIEDELTGAMVYLRYGKG